MQDMCTNCKKLGLTPEMIFRLTDNRHSGVISIKQLVTVLRTIRIGLSGS